MSTKLTRYHSVYLVLAVALVLRILAAGYWQSRIDDDKSFRFGDSDGYWQLAQKISNGESYQYNSEHARIFRTPGYPAFLSSLFLIWQDPPVMAARISGAILGTIAVFLVWWIASQLFCQTTALYSAWLVAFYPGAIAISILVLAEALFVPLMLGQFLTLLKANESSRTLQFVKWAALSGALNGLACLTRPSWLLFLPFLLLVGLVFYSKRYRQLQYFVIALIMTTLVMVPWWIRNYQITGKLVVTSLQTGTSLYDGLNPNATGASDMQFAPRMKREDLKRYRAKEIGPEREFEYWFNEQMKKRALDWARQNPSQVFSLAIRKFIRIWNPVPNSDEIGSKPIRWGIALFFVPMICLCTWGAILNRKDFAATAVCLLPTVYFTLLHMIFVGSIRYRQPPLVVAMVLAGSVLACLLAGKKPFGRGRAGSKE